MRKYDYSKFKDPDWNDDWKYEGPSGPDGVFIGYPDLNDSNDMEYWGLHRINGRLEVDVRRFEYACYRLADHDCFPEALRNKGVYYVASKIHRYDYTSNYLIDSINKMKDDWEDEYKPLFKEIFSPKDAENNYRITTIAMLDSEFNDSVELGARHAALKRERTYRRIQRELYCAFITKIVVEIHRIILRALSMQLYEKPDYCVWDLMVYCNGKGIGFKKLKNWDVYLKYNSICNFLKHNSVSAYEALKKHNPECLIETEREYENGMFAVSWLKLKEASIEHLLEGIVPFLNDFCTKVLDEKPSQASWDYDDNFIDIFNELKDPDEHSGVYEAEGMSPLD